MGRLKYMMVIPEGCADHPLEELDGQTPLAVAETPALDALAQRGRLGMAVTTPNGLDCTDDVTLMSLLGYDPRDHPVGFAAVEAMGMGIEIPEDRWALRLSCVSALETGQLAAGSYQLVNSMTRAELSRLLSDLTEAVRSELADEAGGTGIGESWDFHPGNGSCALLIDQGDRSYGQTIVHPPALIMNELLHQHEPRGEHADLLRKLIHVSGELLADHDVNQVRRELGDPLITCCWPWGAGGPGGRWLRGAFQPFAARYDDLKGAMVCSEDLPAGLASLLGWAVERYDRQALPHEIASSAERVLDEYDVLCIHLTSIDDAAHQGNYNEQIELIGLFDQHLIAPLLHKLEAYNSWRVLVMPSHITRTADGKHDHGPVPLVMAGEMVSSVVTGVYNEEEAGAADLHVPVGSELMEYFLFGAGIGRKV